MKYRLVCIWSGNLKSSRDLSVTIEVCLNVGKKAISPFQRKVTAFDLMRDFEDQNDRILRALSGTGQISQPFNFTWEQLADGHIWDEIENIPTHFIKKGTSLKKIEFGNIRKGIIQPTVPPKLGKIISAELNIKNTVNWWENIDIRFRYDNKLTLIPATIHTAIPFVNDSGHLILRNYEEEGRYLSQLFGHIDNRYSILSLSGRDTIALKYSINAGWRVFIQKNRGKGHSQIKIVPNQYGIDWFATSEGDKCLSDELASKLLTAFLRNQDYYESTDGNISIINSGQIKDLPANIIADAIEIAPNINVIYAPINRLSIEQRQALRLMIDANVQADLMNFQFEGVVWLTEMRNHDTGCLLADDMGLGKTLQTLAYLSTRPEEKQFLVVSPTSIVENWKSELVRFTPLLLDRITIASFDQVRLSPELYSTHEYDTLVVDEGQMVKNANTQRHLTLTQVKRHHTIMLSGTPIENGLHEIWAQFNLLIPGIIQLQDRLHKMMSSSNDLAFVELSRKLLSPFILRRTKEEVLDKFPHKHINDIFIELSPSERVIYKRLKQIAITAIKEGVTGRVNSVVLTGLLRLRQACVCPQILPANLQYQNVAISSKFKTALEIIDSNISVGYKTLVFSQFTSALERFQNLLSDKNIETYILTGSTSDRARLVNDFNNTEGVKVFLISLKAGGTGLNLTAANRVILLDDWWNPAVEEQAFARAHRIGQSQDVEIYRLICKDTIEEKIIDLQEKKKEISDLFNAHYDRMSLENIKELLDLN